MSASSPLGGEPLVFSLVVSWNLREDTLECVRSLLACDYPRQKVIVIDNGSTDGSVEALRASFPQVLVIENGRNLGYAAAVNIGLCRGLEEGAGYFLLVNNDAVCDPRMLAELVTAGEASTDVGIVGPKILYCSRPERIWYLGARRHRLSPLPVDVGCDVPDDGRYEEVGEVDIVCGCGMLLRRSLVERLGPFDERFFVYYEDADYCLRARALGYRVVYAPRARMWHKVSASTAADLPRRRYLRARSRVMFYRRHTRGARRLLLAPLLGASIVSSVLRDVSAGRAYLVFPYLRGIGEGLRAPI